MSRSLCPPAAVASLRLVATTTSARSRPAAASATTRATSRSASSSRAGTCSSTVSRSPSSSACSSCREVISTCEPTTTRPRPPPGRSANSRSGGERLGHGDPPAGARERRADAVDEALARRLGVEQPEHEGLEVAVVDGVDHHRAPALDAGEPLGRAPAADVLERDARHVRGGDPAARALLRPARQVERRVAEGAVARELREPGGNEHVALQHPVDVVEGEAIRPEEGRAQQHAVDAARRARRPWRRSRPGSARAASSRCGS